MSCKLAYTGLESLGEKGYIQSNAEGTSHVIKKDQAAVNAEISDMRKRLVMRFGIAPEKLPGMPYIIGPETEIQLSDESTRIVQEIKINHEFFDEAQKLEDDRDLRKGSTAFKVNEAKEKLEAAAISAAEELGISIKAVDVLKDRMGKDTFGEALADLFNGSIEHLHGKSEHIPHEVLHFWAGILRDTNDPLYASMLSRIKSQPEYALVQNRHDESYSEDDIQIEAIVEVMRNRIKGVDIDRETRWFNRVLARLREIFNPSEGTYKRAALTMFSSSLKQYRAIVSESTDTTLYKYLGAPTREEIRASLLKGHSELELERMEVAASNGQLSNMELFEDGDGYIVRYRLKRPGEEPKTIKFRATDKSTIAFARSMGGIEEVKITQNTKKSILTRETGTTLHDLGRRILHNLAKKSNVTLQDPDNFQVASMDEIKKSSPLTADMFENYKSELSKLISFVEKIQNSIDPTQKADMFTELKIVNKKENTAGTIDILFLFSDGTAAIFDFKFISPRAAFTKGENQSKFIISNPFVGAKMTSYESQLGFHSSVLQDVHGISLIRQSRIIPGHVDFYWKNGEATHINTFHMGGEKNAFLNHIPVANEFGETEKLNDKLQSIYARKKKLSQKESTHLIRQEMKILDEAVQTLLLKLELSSMFRTINSSVNNINERIGIQKEDDPDFMSFAELRSHMETLSMFHGIESVIAETHDGTNDGVQGSIDAAKEMSKIVSESIASLENEMQSRIESYIRRDLDVPAVPVGMMDNYVPMDDVQNNIFKTAKDLINRAISNRKRNQEELFAKWSKKAEMIEKWAGGRMSLSKAYDLLIEDDGKQLTLANMYSKEFNDQVRENRSLGQTDVEKAFKFMRDRYEVKENAKELFAQDKEKAINRIRNEAGITAAQYEAKVKAWLADHDIWNEKTAWFHKQHYRYLQPKKEVSEENWSNKFKFINAPGNEALLDFYLSWKAQIHEFNELLDGKYLKPNMIGSVRVGAVEASLEGKLTSEALEDWFLRGLVVNEDEDDTGGGVLVDKIPFQGVKPLYNKKGEMDSSLVSKNLPRSMYLFGGSVYNYVEKSAIEDQLLFLQYKLSKKQELEAEGNTKWVSGVLTKIGAKSDTITLFDQHIKYSLYGHTQFAKDKTVLGVSGHKLLSTVMKTYVFQMIGFPVKLALGTLGATAVQRYIRGIGGLQYSNKQADAARSMFFLNNKKYMGLANYFQVFAEGNEIHRSRSMYISNVSKVIDESSVMRFLTEADRVNARTITVAMMLNHGLDEEGNIKRLKQLPEGSKNLTEIIEVNEDGFGSSKLSDEAYNDFRHRVMAVAKDVVGEQSSDSWLPYKGTLMGKLVGTFKGWIPGTGTARFGSLKYDERLKELTEGRFIGAFVKGRKAQDYIAEANEWGKVMTGLNQAKFLIFQLIGITNFRASFAYEQELEKRGKLTDEKREELKAMRASTIAEWEHLKKTSPVPELQNISLEEFLEMRETSVRRSWEELRIVLLVTILSMLLSMTGDDKKKYYAKNMATRRLMDLFAKFVLETTFWMNPMEAMKLNNSTIPVLGLVTTLQKIIGNGIQELLVLGGLIEENKRDKTKLFHYTLPLIVPGYRQVGGALELSHQGEKVFI